MFTLSPRPRLERISLRHRALLALCLVVGAIRLVAADAPSPFLDVGEAGRKFVYKQSGGAPRELEVFFPPGLPRAAARRPAAIFFHGGAWGGGNLFQFRRACSYLASRGVVAATANYRKHTRAERDLLPEGESFKRVCITDAKSAIRWMKQHAGELGIDPARLIVGGGSAGGHVGVLATLTPGLDDPADPPEFDTRAAAYLLFNPAFHAGDRADPQVDVLHHLGGGMAPAIFFFGTNDPAWRPGSDTVLRELRARGVASGELWIAAGQAHGFFNQPPWQDVTLAEADRFLVRHGLLQGAGPLVAPATGEKLVRAPQPAD